LSLEAADAGELSALIPDDAFAAEPFGPGDPVALSWAERDIHPLAHTA
jgi:putative spermidine/putrescine transport system ATP-binding protein